MKIEKRPVGRPRKTDVMRQINCQFKAEFVNLMNQTADEKNISRNQLVREAIELYFKVNKIDF